MLYPSARMGVTVKNSGFILRVIFNVCDFSHLYHFKCGKANILLYAPNSQKSKTCLLLDYNPVETGLAKSSVLWSQEQQSVASIKPTACRQFLVLF